MTKSSHFSKRTSEQNALKTLIPMLIPNFKDVISEGIEEHLNDLKKVFFESLMQSEVLELVGTRNSRGQGPKRWGTEKGTAIVDAGKIEVTRPRVRFARGLNYGEVRLGSYSAMNRAELLDGPLTQAVLAGISTRRYADIVSRNMRAKGIKKSSVSRRVIAATKPVVDQFLKRDLSKLSPVAIFIDGVHVSGSQSIAAVCVDLNGRKHVLGLRLGASENEIVCRDLLRDMVQRGLDADSYYLFIIDGSRALATAIRTVFGPNALIQRCQEHKIRDVEAYLPFKMRQSFRQKMNAAYSQKTERSALTKLAKIRTEISFVSAKAVSSLTEGMYETLTVHRLGVTGALRTSLRTTNIIESAFASVRRYMNRVKRFQSEEQRDRWTIWSLVEAEKHFRCVEGHRQVPDLKKALKRACEKSNKKN
jgi:putative transposase